MPSNPNTRRGIVNRRASAFIFIAALASASSAQTGTITFSCEGEVGADGSTAPRNWTIDIDYDASRVRFSGYSFGPAVITDREITFRYRDANGHAIEGRVDRFAGTISVGVKRSDTTYVFGIGEQYRGRCRPATTRM